MTDYKQLCAELLRYWDDAPTPSDFVDTNGYGTIQRIRAALAKSESSGNVTDNNHPMLPTQEQLTEWDSERFDEGENFDVMMIKAFQAGADQELEACCEWLDKAGSGLAGTYAAYLRAARRPKPPSLKEQALEELELLRGDANAHGLGFDAPAIRRALESLPK